MYRGTKTMAYSIHIKRIADDGSPIEPPLALHEWESKVNETDGLRFDSSARSVTNPATGQVITIIGSDGDAEMLVDGRWLPVFRWSDGRASFNGLPSFDNPNDPIRKMAMHLAACLNARVVGDEGEFYK